MHINATEILLLLALVVSVLIVMFRSRWRPAEALTKTRQGRLKRIKNASCWIQVLISLSFILGIYWILAFIFGWPFISQGKVRIVISQSHIYTSPAEMPQAMLVWWLVKMGLTLCCYGVLFSLFRLYQKGILFSVKNIRHIHVLAYYIIANWLVDYQLQSSLHDMDLSTTPVFVGLMIIFVAWIMDEGRKIQEEQELTV